MGVWPIAFVTNTFVMGMKTAFAAQHDGWATGTLRVLDRAQVAAARHVARRAVRPMSRHSVRLLIRVVKPQRSRSSPVPANRSPDAQAMCG